ncbi:hypothetical protein AAG570_000687 [Ranatra chinensis]|uniref:Cytochrome b5 heme-binding domain-containing protein n=1 Tax=Ranatra chinensis TaxID=642074 RepID=A0ABD0Z857_9HEMI
MSWSEWKYPKWLDETSVRTGKKWLDARREDDGAEGLWRIHDSLYDLNEWIESHPGGRFWIETTKGTDITEAFESHHLSDNPEAILPKFFAKKATGPRNSPFTFNKDGFYHTLKAKVKNHLANVKNGPATPTKIISDTLAGTTIILSILAGYYCNYLIGIAAAVFLTGTVITGHNFFHQRNNWRMYYFNLSLMSARDWRISHALSHHLYPNTIHDLEVSMFEPFFQWLPKPNKTLFARYVSWLYAPIVYTLIYHTQYISRALTNPDGMYEFVPLVIPGAMMIIGGVNLLASFVMWNFILFTSSFIFGCIGLNAAHHHPEIFHDGDVPRADRDWGLFQLDAVRDRLEIKGILPLVITLFGDHSLHHLFPTLDHCHLVELYPILEDTCKEFGYDFKFTTISDLVQGQFLQLARNKSKLKQETN